MQTKGSLQKKSVTVFAFGFDPSPIFSGSLIFFCNTRQFLALMEIFYPVEITPKNGRNETKIVSGWLKDF